MTLLYKSFLRIAQMMEFDESSFQDPAAQTPQQFSGETEYDPEKEKLQYNLNILNQWIPYLNEQLSELGTQVEQIDTQVGQMDEQTIYTWITDLQQKVEEVSKLTQPPKDPRPPAGQMADPEKYQMPFRRTMRKTR